MVDRQGRVEVGRRSQMVVDRPGQSEAGRRSQMVVGTWSQRMVGTWSQMAQQELEVGRQGQSRLEGGS